MAETQVKTDVPALTGIRGIAALTVVLSHIAIWTSWDWHGITVVPGQWAVDIFFVLSGFVISMTYLRSGTVNWRRFFSARFARIYPLHIATAAILGGLYTWHVIRGGPPNPAVTPLHLLREITLTSAMPIVGDGLMWNDPSWSICVESWVYILIFPVIAWLTIRVPPKSAAAVLLVLLALLGGFLTTLPDGVWVKVGWIAFGRAVIEFAAGWAAYRLMGKITIPGALTDVLAIALPVVLVAARLAMGGRDAWFLMPVFPIFVLGLTNPKSLATRLFSTGPMVFLGNISYSIYLVHAVVKFLIGPLVTKLHMTHSTPFYVFVFIPIVVVCSIGTYYGFERPARDGLRNLLDRRDKPEPSAAKATF